MDNYRLATSLLYAFGVIGVFICVYFFSLDTKNNFTSDALYQVCFRYSTTPPSQCIERGVGYVLKNGDFITVSHLYKTGGELFALQGNNSYQVQDIRLDTESDILKGKILSDHTGLSRSEKKGEIGETIFLPRLTQSGWMMLTGKILSIDITRTLSDTLLSSGVSISHLFEIDIPVEAGESGSPILNQKQEVIGTLLAQKREGRGGYGR